MSHDDVLNVTSYANKVLCSNSSSITTLVLLKHNITYLMKRYVIRPAQLNYNKNSRLNTTSCFIINHDFS